MVIDLEVGPFRPGFAGKMNFYLNVVDDELRREHGCYPGSWISTVVDMNEVARVASSRSPTATT